MFIVLLEYQAELAEIDRLMPAHVEFLEHCYRAGVFLVSGRREPREGGVIVASGVSRPRLGEIMEMDPFVREEVASYEIIEFRSSLHHPALGPFADPGTRAVKDVPGDS